MSFCFNDVENVWEEWEDYIVNDECIRWGNSMENLIKEAERLFGVIGEEIQDESGCETVDEVYERLNLDYILGLKSEKAFRDLFTFLGKHHPFLCDTLDM